MGAQHGATMLHFAAECKNVNSVKALLSAPGVNAHNLVWNVDLTGRTALHLAAESGQFDICDVLLGAMATGGERPVGARAPVDLSGLTPAAWCARGAQALRKATAEDEAQYAAVKKLLFAPGDTCILPMAPVEERCGGDHLAFGVGEAPGWRVLMEDARCAYSPIPFNDSVSLFAVFDGHGGAFSSRFAASNIQRVIFSSEAWQSCDLSPKALSSVLSGALLALDLELAAEPRMVWGGKDDTEDCSGATALVALVTPSHVALANCGDCEAVLIAGEDWEGLPLSLPHKPTDEGELRRISDAGLTVKDNRVDGILAVSRSLGDFRFKQNAEKPAETQAVTALADVHIHARSDKEVLLLMACDGIWDVLSHSEAAALMKAQLQVRRAWLLAW